MIDHAARRRDLEELARRLTSPHDIQRLLNNLPYSTHDLCLSPWRVLKEQSAHCAEGAYLAAAIFSLQGGQPLVVDLLAENDDDHLIAPFRIDGRWGAVAKSNTTMLRYREPVYENLRELVMSYFDCYFNTNGFKSLRAYSESVNLDEIDGPDWMTSDDDLNFIGERITAMPHHAIVDEKMRSRLSPADPDLVKACFLGSREEGLFKPR